MVYVIYNGMSVYLTRQWIGKSTLVNVETESKYK